MEVILFSQILGLEGHLIILSISNREEAEASQKKKIQDTFSFLLVDELLFIGSLGKWQKDLKLSEMRLETSP